MSSLQIILLLTIGAVILVVILFSSILYWKIRKKNIQKEIEQVSNEPYFINEKHLKEKWWISLDGSLEKNWMKGQDYEFKISFFDYFEDFSKGFFNSKFTRTKLFLIKIMDAKSVRKIIRILKYRANCLDNIWWKKFKILMQSSFEDMPKVTNAPEYFFYKYYFEFIFQLRKIMGEYLTNYIIPNTIFLELKPIYYKQYGIKIVEEPHQNIVFAFEQVAKEADALSTLLYSQFSTELASKGAEWTIDHKSKKDLLHMLQEDEYIQKLFTKDKSSKLSKKNKLSVWDNLEQAINNIETYMKSVNENQVS